MKVLFGTVNQSDQIKMLMKGISRLGCEVTLQNKLTCDNQKKYAERILHDQEVCHFHFGISITGTRHEYKYARKKNKVCLIHYWGDEIRPPKLAVQHNPYVQLLDTFEDEKVINKHLRAKKYVSACIVPQFELVPYIAKHFDRIYVLPFAVETNGKRKKNGKVKDKPLIVYNSHSKNENEVEFIEDTLRKLRLSGYHFRSAGMNPRSPKSSDYDQADLVIDQIMLGSYTPFAVEAMARGKSVISYIREDLKAYMPRELPLISANPSILYNKVEAWLNHFPLTKGKGTRGLNFARRYHDLSVVAKQLKWIYEHEGNLLRRKTNAFQFPAVHVLWGSTVNIYLLDPDTRYIAHNFCKTGLIEL